MSTQNTTPTLKANPDAVLAELDRLRAENAALKALAEAKVQPLRCKISEKGAVSVYGLGQWPVTLYREQWERLLAFADQIRAFIAANRALLPSKAEKAAQAKG